jgi:hypothetical protein
MPTEFVGGEKVEEVPPDRVGPPLFITPGKFTGGAKVTAIAPDTAVPPVFEFVVLLNH